MLRIWPLTLVLAALPALAQSVTTKPATGPASQPASAPSREQLEQARSVFRQLLAQPTDADKARIAKLIAQLGVDNWKDREEATAALKKEPLAALGLLRQGAASEDPETALRCKDIISALESQRAAVRALLRQAITTRQRAGDAAVVGDLIALLDDDDSAIRSICGTRLQHLTGQDFEYQAMAETDQRKQAVKKAQEWWEKNKATFALADPAGREEDLALDLGNKVTMKFSLIPAGKFLMGSPQEETERADREGPQHEVTITKPFYMGTHHVTQEQYEQVMGMNPSQFKGPQNPVEMVSWDDAVDFCRKLSQKTGKTVRLPTEAQWEYACRAGTKTRFSFGDKSEDLSDYAWHDANSGRQTHPVGQKIPNAFDLYDMHGNVWQWCTDWLGEDYRKSGNTDPQGPESGNSRVLRGGCWYNSPSICRSAFRMAHTPTSRKHNVGFRVVVESRPATQPATSPATAPATQPAAEALLQ